MRFYSAPLSSRSPRQVARVAPAPWLDTETLCGWVDAGFADNMKANVARPGVQIKHMHNRFDLPTWEDTG